MERSERNDCVIQVIRHGEALHNVERGHPFRDPPLTEAGEHTTKAIRVPTAPDIILISPMTRTIQTALNAFPTLLGATPSEVEVQIWPDLREANDATCNKGLSRADLQAKFPQFDFSECLEEWDYPSHSVEGATARAEKVRCRLKELSAVYKSIVVITHRGLIAFLTKGRRFGVCEARSYQFASTVEAADLKIRMGVNCDTLEQQDFGPTVLLLRQASTSE